MNRGIFLCLIVLAFFTCSYFCEKGDTYYVSPVGDDNNQGTKNSPFKTIKHALSEDGNVGSILLLPGLFTESVTFQSGSQISIESAYPSAPAVISGQGANSCFNIYGNVNITGIQFQNCLGSIIISSSYYSKIDIKSSKFTGDNSVAALRISNYNSNVNVTGCDFESNKNHIKMDSYNNYGGYFNFSGNSFKNSPGNGIVMSKVTYTTYVADNYFYNHTNAPLSLISCNDVLVTKCTFTNNYHSAIDVQSSSGRISNCFFNKNNATTMNGAALMVSGSSSNFGVVKSVFSNNIAMNGAISSDQSATINVQFSALVGNSASDTYSEFYCSGNGEISALYTYNSKNSGTASNCQNAQLIQNDEALELLLSELSI